MHGGLSALAVLLTVGIAWAAPLLRIAPLGYHLVQVTQVPNQPTPTIEIVARAGMLNEGDPALNVSATLTSSTSGVAVLDGLVSFGNVPLSNVRPVTSQDTFTLRVTLPAQVKPKNLAQLYSFAKSVLSGLRWTINCDNCGGNQAPVSNAGADQTVYVSSLVTLDGSASTDGDGNALTYKWSFVSRPATSTAVLSSTTAVRPTFTVDSPGSYVLQLIVNDGQQDSAADTVTITTQNSAPVARAGADQTVDIGDPVQLNGTLSSDVDGNTLTYVWNLLSRPDGSAATLTDPTTATPRFTPSVAGQYVVELVVDDGTVSSTPDTVVITTRPANAAPTANAGADQTVPLGGTAQLDGSASSDPDAGDVLSYAWSLLSRPTGSTATLTAADSAQPSFPVDRKGDYVAQLTVSDGKASSTDTVLVSTQNGPPTANAGANQTVHAGSVVQLDGSASSDPDNDPLGFTWSLLNLPAGSTATLSDPFAINPIFTADLPGLYISQLIVNDGHSDSAPATVNTTATNAVPIAVDDTATTPSNTAVLISVLGNDTDADNDTLSVQSVTTPAYGTAVILGAQVRYTPTTGFSGEDEFNYTINDGLGGTALAKVTITVTFVDDLVPTAVLGVTPNPANAGATVTLTGVDSTDVVPGTVVRYTFTLVSAPVGYVTSNGLAVGVPVGQDTSSRTFVPNVAGSYVLQLIVRDSGGNDSTAASATLIVVSSDLAVAKTVSNAAPTVGTDVTFTVTVGNNGPSNATAVSVTDALPSGYAFGSANASQGTFSNTTGAWSVGAVTSGDDATLTITATVLATGNYTNTASLLASTPSDPNSANNSASVVVTPVPVVNPNVTVPDVTGQTQAAATTALTAADLAVGTVTQEASDSVAAGSVISQSPTAGVSVARGSVVDLVVSSGPVVVEFVPVRVEIDPIATLVQPNSSQALSGVLVDAAGNRQTSSDLTWTSESPGIVTVTAQGVVTAGASLGLGRIRARFGELESNPAWITVAVPAADVRLIEDSDLIAGPVAVDASLRPSLNNAYEVVVRGGMDFVEGQKLINTGMAPVGGRVLEVSDEGGNQRLRLLLVPLPELLENYSIDETFDITQGVVVPAEVLAAFDVTVVGSTYSFKPKSSVASLALTESQPPAAPASGKQGNTSEFVALDGPVGTSAAEPVCEFKNEGLAPLGVPFPIALSRKPTVTITLGGEFQVQANDTEGLKTYALRAEPTFEIKETITVEAAFAGKATCDYVWLEKTIPFPGVFGLLFGTILEFGPGVELSGKITTASIQTGARAFVGGVLGWNLKCSPQDCDLDFEGSAPADKRGFEPKFEAEPFEPKVEAGLSMYGFAKAKIGSALLESLQVEVLGAKLGFGFEGKFAVPSVQAASTELASNYKLSLTAGIEPGKDVQDLVDKLGFEAVKLPSLEFAKADPLAQSPQGTVQLDRTSYLAGDEVNVSVQLDENTLDFLLVDYNVDRIEIRRRTGPLTTELLATIDPIEGETDLSASFVAPGLLTDDEVFAFVVSKILPLEILGLEVTKPVNGISASGGVFRSVLLNEPGTSLLLKLRSAEGTLVPVNTQVTVSGPPASGWNNGVGLVLNYPASAVRQFYTINAAVRPGTYTASATIDGKQVLTTFDVDTSQSLPLATNIIAQEVSSTSITGSWDTVPDAQSYQVRVFDRVNNVLLEPRQFAFAPVATLRGLSPALVPGGDYGFQVFAFNTDLTVTDPVMPDQFNISFNRSVLGARVDVFPTDSQVFVGSNMQFSANVIGLADTRVTWSATGGQINAGGFWTTPNAAGTYTVTATSVARPDLNGSATITVRSASTCTPESVQTALDGTYDVISQIGGSLVGACLQFQDSGSLNLSGGVMTFSNGFSPSRGGYVCPSGFSGLTFPDRPGNGFGKSPIDGRMYLSGNLWITRSSFCDVNGVALQKRR